MEWRVGLGNEPQAGSYEDIKSMPLTIDSHGGSCKAAMTLTMKVVVAVALLETYKFDKDYNFLVRSNS